MLEHVASTTLLIAAAVGLACLAIQRLALGFALARTPASTITPQGISILKPLCGIDDDLEANLEHFATLDGAPFEVILGVKDTRDLAWPVACRLASRWPDRFRVVLQQGEPGLNPKVNQLATLARHARFEVLLISDSNTRPPAGYLNEIAALFEAPRVGCVSSAVSGLGHESFGALLDNLHLASSVGAGQLAAKQLANQNLVVGKSMAVRAQAMAALGGFGAYANVLAEDYVIGRDLVHRLGLQVAIARRPVWNVAVRRSVGSFFKRYLRWGVIHRTAVSLPTSLAQGLLNPWPLTLLALGLSPTRDTAAASLVTLAAKTLLDLSSAHRLGCPVSLACLPAVAVKDLLLFIAWAHGQVSRTVDWRGNRLRVTSGSRLLTTASPLHPLEGTAS